MKNINYSIISDIPEVGDLLKQRRKIEEKIMQLDEFALVTFELHLLSTENNLL